MALAWHESLDKLARFQVLDCKRADLGRAWAYFKRKDLHKLSAVDATSFSIMTREGISLAFSFDHHFVTAGFRLVD